VDGAGMPADCAGTMTGMKGGDDGYVGG
jgi:hypothetical protein